TDLVPIETAHLPPVSRRYERDKVYNISVDLVPEFLALSADKHSLCIVASASQTKPLAKLLSNEGTFYRISVSGTHYSGMTQQVYNLKTFYDAAIRDGASECRYRDGRISFK